MSREIKFRGVSLADGKLIYGWGCFTTDNERQFVMVDQPAAAFVEVKKGSLQEYTGLKDKNGREIYEGDIVAIDDGIGLEGTIREHREVKWLEGKHGFDFAANDRGWSKANFGMANSAIFRVIGNFYENPELLKEASE